MARNPAKDCVEPALDASSLPGVVLGLEMGGHLDEREMELLFSQYQDDMLQTSRQSVQQEMEEKLLKDCQYMYRSHTFDGTNTVCFFTC